MAILVRALDTMGTGGVRVQPVGRWEPALRLLRPHTDIIDLDAVAEAAEDEGCILDAEGFVQGLEWLFFFDVGVT